MTRKRCRWVRREVGRRHSAEGLEGRGVVLPKAGEVMSLFSLAWIDLVAMLMASPRESCIFCRYSWSSTYRC